MPNRLNKNEGNMPQRTWTPDLEQLLKEHYQTAARAWLEATLHHSWIAIISHASLLSVGPRLVRQPASEETRRLRGLATKGIPKSAEARRHIAEGKRGKKFLPAHCAAMSRARKAMGLQTFLGRHHTEESKQRMRDAKRQVPLGPGKYQGNNAEWRAMAARVRERDSHKCMICGDTGGKTALPVHHIISYQVACRHDEFNLITLCRRCHRNVETLELWDYCAQIMVQHYNVDPTGVFDLAPPSSLPPSLDC
jgi:5-methylcytosine-specific restriction endonuclease McrA